MACLDVRRHSREIVLEGGKPRPGCFLATLPSLGDDDVVRLSAK